MHSTSANERIGLTSGDLWLPPGRVQSLQGVCATKRHASPPSTQEMLRTAQQETNGDKCTTPLAGTASTQRGDGTPETPHGASRKKTRSGLLLSG